MVIKDNTQYFEFNITGYEFSEINDMWDDWYRMYFLIKQNEQKLAEETDCCVLTFEALIIIENLNKLLKGEVSVCESDFTEPYFKILIRKQSKNFI